MLNLSMQNAEALYAMRLLEIACFNDLPVQIVRVPGGWVFITKKLTHEVASSMVFVPHNNEFNAILGNKLLSDALDTLGEYAQGTKHMEEMEPESGDLAKLTIKGIKSRMRGEE